MVLRSITRGTTMGAGKTGIALGLLAFLPLPNVLFALGPPCVYFGCVSLGQTSTTAGNTIAMPAYMALGAPASPVPRIGVQFTLNYDSTALAITATPGQVALDAGKAFTAVDLAPGVKRITIEPSNANLLAAGTVANLQIQALLIAGVSGTRTYTIRVAGTITNPQREVVSMPYLSDGNFENGVIEVNYGRLAFHPITPCRVMETRSLYNFEGRTGSFGPPTLAASETRTLKLPSSNVCHIPSNALSYMLNVTLIPGPGGTSYVTIWPTSEPVPNVWTIRSPDGQIVANSAIVKPDRNGNISVYTSDSTDLLIDVAGYFTDTSVPSGLSYYPLTPCRIVDTRILYRPLTGPFGPPSMRAGETRKFRFPAAPYCTLPAAGAYSVTVTAVPPGPLAYLTAWQDGSAQPNISTMNSFAGRILANNVIIPASPDGSVNVYTYDATDFIMDVNGYFAPDDGTNGLYYYPVTQCRTFDSTPGAPFGDETTRTLNLPASPNCSGNLLSAKAYAINVTAIPNGNPMPFLTAYPTGQSRPNASILNAFQGQIVSNFAIIPAGSNSAVDVYAYRRTHVVVDLSGFFAR